MGCGASSPGPTTGSPGASPKILPVSGPTDTTKLVDDINHSGMLLGSVDPAGRGTLVAQLLAVTNKHDDDEKERSGMRRRMSLPGEMTKGDGDFFTRCADSDTSVEPSAIDEAKEQCVLQAKALAAGICEPSGSSRAKEEAIIENIVSGVSGLRGCIFVGHIVTDMDSIATAVGAAHLFGGEPARAERVLNGEILAALEFSGIEQPTYFSDIPDNATRGICLVDHNAATQLVAELNYKDPSVRERIKGVIDHHAVAEDFCSAGPVYMDVRPWGSASSIVTHSYVRFNKQIPEKIARLLLCGILSDTLNLTSVTTTDADRLMCVLLCLLGKVQSANTLARDLFKAKTEWFVGLGAYEIIRGDCKRFEEAGWQIAFATVEVTNGELVLTIADELLVELRLLKKEEGKAEADMAFLTVVDIVKQQTTMLICGGRELKLAKIAFPDAALSCAIRSENTKFKEVHKLASKHLALDETAMDLGKRMSRKKQFIPAIKKAIGDGFSLSEVEVTEGKCEKVRRVTRTESDNAGHMIREYGDTWENNESPNVATATHASVQPTAAQSDATTPAAPISMGDAVFPSESKEEIEPETTAKQEEAPEDPEDPEQLLKELEEI